MTERPDPPVSQEEILDRLSAMTKELAHLHATAVKYPALKKILGDVAAGLPADTRMPGIRDLAERLGISLVTAQRAVAELAAEDVLYSRPRSGNFVRGRSSAAAPPSPASASSQHPFRAVFSFGTDSAAPHQREFWEELAARFSARHPSATPALRFIDEPSDFDRLPDAHERYDRNFTPEKEAELLDLAAFAGGRLPVAPARGRLLPLYYRTYFLFWNRSLLERHGLPAPAYRTFDGQAEYLRGVAPALERLGLESQPYSIQEPVTLLGGAIADFVRLLGPGQGDSGLREGLVGTLERLLAFCRLLHYSTTTKDTRWVQARQDFVRGREPFFLGYSVDYWDFAQARLPFALEAYPTLCCDDALFLWPRLGAVARRSEHPVESLNFLLFLLDRESQDRFAATGNFGAADGVYPATGADPEWIAATRRRSAPFQFATREDYYMAVNVLGDAIWRSLIEGIPAAETLEQALRVGGSYLRHRPPRV